ncbi:DUF4168 domain-containing protein [Pararhodonellum marinum]|uniref:DUF4168 domain-containing protein n=1 Tax=Pararhodonellum marinum TaxID=2755358 RepID=UPI001E2A97D5|nr:DUF4168 domain-containing protein [Pararhodonellum marinum]
MTYSKLTKIFTLSALFSFVFAFGAMSQQQLPPAPQQQANVNFSEDDYKAFVKINKEIIPIQQDAQETMLKEIEGKGMDVNRFQEMAQAQQAGKITDVSEDPEEIAKFNEAGQKVMEVQQEAQQTIQKKIMEHEFPMEKFQQMSMAYNQNEEVRAKVDKMLQEDE